ncbi:hypothetical protein N2152v2_007426 [Parachlorella kessleri]
MAGLGLTAHRHGKSPADSRRQPGRPPALQKLLSLRTTRRQGRTGGIVQQLYLTQSKQPTAVGGSRPPQQHHQLVQELQRRELREQDQRQQQEEEDARLAAEEQRVMQRMEELEAQEAAAEGPFAGFGGLLGAAWPFGRRRFLPPPAPVLEAGGPAARTRGQRSGGRPSRWQAFGAHHLAGLPLPGALGGPHGWDAEPPSSRVALRAIRGAQHSNLPPHMLFRELGEEDYELLLRLDEGVENRKGASKALIDSLETVRIPRAGAGAGSVLRTVGPAYTGVDCCTAVLRSGAGRMGAGAAVGVDL